MTTTAEGIFKVTDWNEERYAEMEDNRGLSIAIVTQDFTGDIEGTGSVRWLMFYRPDGTADWMGLQEVTGRIGDRAGSFVMQSNGTFDGTTATGEWTVLPDSGTGELAGLSGEGQMAAPIGDEASYHLDYDLR